MTIAQFEANFPDEETCKAYLVARRWPNGVYCPRCGNTKVYTVDRALHWQCYECAAQRWLSVFPYRRDDLREYQQAAPGVVPRDAPDADQQEGHQRLAGQRVMGFGSYETAHSMCHKIRAALDRAGNKLGGIVEVDETYVGGKTRTAICGTRAASAAASARKTPMVGAVSRKGNVIARVSQSRR